MSILVGSEAPAFTLNTVHASSEVAEATLESFRGRWLALVFYPRDFSFVCPTELTSFSAQLSEFSERDCAVLGVSIDSIESHKSWLGVSPTDGGVGGLRFPLASDPSGAMCRSYGVWRDADDLPNRGLFLIDPEGVVQYAVVHGLGVGRSVDEVLRVLDALRTGGLCPANWVGTDGTIDVAALLQPGRVLGHYQLENEVGRGSFGSVFRAIDLRLERQVAVKVIRDESTVSRSKILSEARAAAAIAHPSVCTVHSVEEIDGLPLIVMEFVPGSTFGDVIGGGLQDAEFWSIATPLASGLAAAHSAGVVHGDLKPGNVLLRESGDPVIVDFGLAQSGKGSPVPAGGGGVRTEGSTEAETIEVVRPVVETATVDVDVVVAGTASEDSSASDDSSQFVIRGTPAYLSPEQARGQPASSASDVFALGLIFVRMLTGVGPLEGYSSLADILGVLGRDDCGQRMAEAVSSEYRSLIGKMLESDSETRISAAEVATLCEKHHPHRT